VASLRTRSRLGDRRRTRVRDILAVMEEAERELYTLLEQEIVPAFCTAAMRRVFLGLGRGA